MIQSAIDKTLDRPSSSQFAPMFWSAALTILMIAAGFLPAVNIFSASNEYLTFHTSAELFSIAIALMVFSLAWNLRDQARSGRDLIIGLGFLAVALVDMAHVMAFPGMPGFLVPSSL